MCTSLPNLLLYAPTTTTPTTTDGQPRDPRPPPHHPPPGSTGPSHARCSNASTTTSCRPEPTTRLGIRSTTTMCPTMRPCYANGRPYAYANANANANGTSTMCTTMYGCRTSMPSCMPTNLL